MAKKKKKNTGRTVLRILLALVLIGAGCAACLYFGIKNYNKAVDLNATEEIDLVVENGSSTYKIAHQLEDAGLIANADIFRFKSRFNKLDSKFQAGYYKLKKSMTMDEIMTELQTGRKKEVSFTIPEGLTISEIALKLKTDGMISSLDEFYDALNDYYPYSFIPEKGYAVGNLSANQNRLEGYLYPETYNIQEGATAHDIIDTMLAHFDELITDEINTSIPSGYKLHDIVILASIIEEECGADSDRAKISGVFWNRLNLPMRLQSDVTINYALGENYFSTDFDSPFNTYLVDGLPVGPICSPTIKSIKAALNPESHDYYYFVLKGDGSGECNFATTWDEHQYNVWIWEHSEEFAKYWH